MKRFLTLAAIVLVCGIIAGLTSMIPDAQARGDLFTVGERIGVITDCMSLEIVPPGTNPCFTEFMRVRVVRPDGWLEVTEAAVTDQGLRDTDKRWIVNPARIYAFQREPAGGLVAVR